MITDRRKRMKKKQLKREMGADEERDATKKCD